MQAKKGSMKYLEKLESSDKKNMPSAIHKDKSWLSNNVPKRELMLNENSEVNVAVLGNETVFELHGGKGGKGEAT